MSFSIESEDFKTTTATVGSSSVDEVVSTPYISPQVRETLTSLPNGASSVSPTVEESSNTTERSATSQEAAAPSPVDRINTATLGPSEVRRGLAESITERNATIYKYNTKHVPVRRAPRVKSASKEEPIPEGTTACEESERAENEEESEAAEEQQEAAEVEEENAKERVPTPEPYNPYVDFEVSDVDLPLVARLLRNVEPNLLWTWTRDSISFKHLSREQVVNRFPNTPFTTKVRRSSTSLTCPFISPSIRCRYLPFLTCLVSAFLSIPWPPHLIYQAFVPRLLFLSLIIYLRFHISYQCLRYLTISLSLPCHFASFTFSSTTFTFFFTFPVVTHLP